MNKRTDITIFVAGGAIDAIVNYESEYQPADPDVGIFTDDFGITIHRVETELGNLVAHSLGEATRVLGAKEVKRISDWLSDHEMEENCKAQDAERNRREEAQDRREV